MITRRDAVKLSAAGLVVPTIGSALATAQGTPVVQSTPTAQGTPVAQKGGGNYPMAGGNPARTGGMPGPGPSLDEPIIVKWMFPIDGDYVIPPSIVDGTLYLGGNGNLVHAIDAAAGEEQWRFETAGSINGTPAVGNGSVYVNTVAYDEFSEASIHAIDTASGEERWRFESEEGTSGITVADGTVFFSSENAIHAVDAVAGEERWRFSLDNTVSVPAVANGTVFVTDTTSFLYAIDAASGDEIWRFNTGATSYRAPVVEAAVFVGTDHTRLYAVDAVSGKERWRFDDASSYGEDYFNVDAVVGGTVFATCSSGVYAVDSDSGLEQWHIENIGDNEPRLMVVDGSVLIAIGEGLVMVDATSGEEQWRMDYVPNLSQFGNPVVAGGTVYFGFEQRLIALGNLLPAVLLIDVQLRGAPSESGVARGTAQAGTEVTLTGNREERGGITWVEVTIGDLSGWIPLEVIDPATLPPDNALVVYEP